MSRYIIYPTLTSFSVLPFLPPLQLLESLNLYMCGHNFTMKFSPDFHHYTGLNGLVNSFSYLTIAPGNKLILGWKPYWSAKMKIIIIIIPTTSCEKSLLGDVLQKSFAKNYTEFTEKYLSKSLFLILLKPSRLLGLQLYYRENLAPLF